MEKVIEFPCNAQQYKWIVLTISWIFLKCLYMDVLPRYFLVLMFIGPWYQGPFPEQWSPYGQASLRVSIFGSGNLPPATSSPPEEFQDENDLPKVSRHSFYWKIQIRFYVRPCRSPFECMDSFNPLHPNISVHILHTALYTFLMSLTRRICLTIKSFMNSQSFHNCHDRNVCWSTFTVNVIDRHLSLTFFRHSRMYG